MLTPFEARLLRLLGSALLTTDVLADISRISRLADDALEGAPCVTGGGWCALVSKLSVDTCSELVDGLLDKGALSDTRAEEDGVDHEEDPAALLEEQSGANDAEPEGDLEHGDECHGSIVVLLHEFANGLGGTGSLLGASGCGGRRRLDGGKKVGSHVCCDVEDGVDRKGSDCERDLAREEPYESHN